MYTGSTSHIRNEVWLRMFESVPSLSNFEFCNVLHIWTIPRMQKSIQTRI